MPDPAAESTILTPDNLRAPFLEACKARTRYRLGTEAEKFGVLSVDGSSDATTRHEPLPFEGDRGVKRILAGLANHGHEPVREYEDGEAIALRRDSASITLEPAAQLELSGAPLATVQETEAELQRHLKELHGISDPLGISWLSVGFHPFARHADLPRVPKLRYRIMEAYLPTRGSGGLDMMRRTCTVQVNLDYTDTSDAMRKLRVALALQPITTAMFANSPFYEGSQRGLLSERANVWCHMDPDRSGLLPFAWDQAARLDDYIDWALDVPMFMVKRGAKVLENTGQTFRKFMEDGFSGARATGDDWESHINTLFPEVRLKRTLEVRGADAQPTDTLCAVPALWKGLLYDETALSAAESLIERFDPAEIQRVRPEIARQALRATVAGKSVQHWAQTMVEIAESGLARLESDPDIPAGDEKRYLSPLKNLLGQGKTPADQLLAKVGPSPSRADIVAACRV